MMGNSAREAFIRLLQEKEHWENYRKMLKCLCEEHKQDLTLGGSLLSETPAEDFPNLIWLNVELGFPDANKSDRMWPVAFKHQFQEEIEELHKPFFANTEEFSDTEELDGWEEATEGWLTPSKFMTSYRVEDVDYFVFLTDECTERASSLHEELRSLGARAITYYPDGDQLKVLFPDRKGRSHSLTEFQGCYRNGLNLKKFIKWLKGNHEIAQVEMEENVGIYIGYEHSIEDDARLYAAFRGKAAASEVKNACRLIDRIHEDPIRKVIRDSLKPDYRLEMFWRDTEEWFDNEYPHDWHDWDYMDGVMGKDQWKQEIEVVLSEYLGDIRDWLEDSNAEQLHYALKEICGQFSKFNGSQDPLSVFGAYLIFLMGAYDRLKSNSLLSDAKDIGWSTFDVDNDDYYLIESDASKKDARSAAKSLFHFGHEICVHEDDIEKSDSMRRQVLGKPELSSSCLSVPLELGEKSKGLVASVEDVPYSDGSTTKHLDQLQESGSFSKKSGRIHFELIVDEGEVHMRFEPQPCRHAMIGTPTYG